MTSTASTQSVARPGVIELPSASPTPRCSPPPRWPTPAARRSPTAAARPCPTGPTPARRRCAAASPSASAARERARPASDETLISGGVSQALEQLVTLFCRPGDVVLVERPTYSLALGILRDHPVVVEALPFDDQGLDVAALERRLVEARATGHTVRLLYTIPTFHNPTGISLSAERRRRLVEVAAAYGLLVGRRRRLPRALVRRTGAALAVEPRRARHRAAPGLVCQDARSGAASRLAERARPRRSSASRRAA